MNAERPGLYLQQTDEEREYGSVYRRRTNYNITTKRQTIIYQTLYLKLMIKQQELH